MAKTISADALKDAFSKSIAIGRIIRWHFGDGESEDKAVDEIEAHINAIIDQQPQAYAPPANEQPMSDWVRMVDAKKLASAIDQISKDDCWKQASDPETAFNEAVSMCKQAVLQAPTVSAYGSWMDARTNPPDDDREVIADSNGDVLIACKYDDDWVQYLPDEDGDLIPHVISVQRWMEKPETVENKEEAQ